MPVIDFDEVRAYLPTLRLSPTSEPNQLQVEQYIIDIESEVRATILAFGGTWPTDPTTPAYQYMRLVVITGVIWMVMRAKYALFGDQGMPTEVNNARIAYESRLKRLGEMGVTAIIQGGSGAGYDVPVLADDDSVPIGHLSFAEWTELQAAVGYRSGRNTFYPRPRRW